LRKKTSPDDAIPRPQFPEDVVISELLKASSEFIAFYHAERGKITKPIYWVKNSSLPVGIDHRYTRLPAGAQVIHLRRVPAILGDAVKIAHELQHLLLDLEGFSGTSAQKQFENISSSLNSMVSDPLVSSRLKVYGFNLDDDFKAERKETLSQLSSIPNAPSEHAGRMRWIFNYVGQILEREIVYSTANKGEDEFRLWFDARYPDLAQEAEGLLALVREIGYETPYKQAVLFRTVIRRYGLRKIVFL
jgi:hypothetical protein